MKSFTGGRRDGLRHALRALALGGPGWHRHQPGQRHLVAHAARRHGAAHRCRQLERRLRPVRQRGRHRHDPAQLRLRPLHSTARARGPAALRARGGQVVQHRARLVVGGTGPDDHPLRWLHARAGVCRSGPCRRWLEAGAQRVNYWGTDVGGGVRFSETRLDGARVGLTEYPCAKAMIDGEWRATRMLPCPTGAADELTVQTTSFSDGPHELTRCATDFAGNSACLFPTSVLIDNHPPAHPRNLALAGRRGLASAQRLRLRLAEPRSGAGQPDRRRLLADHRLGRLRHRRQPRLGARHLRARRPDAARSGVYAFHIWLRDEAGNADSGVGDRNPDAPRRRAAGGRLRSRARPDRHRATADGRRRWSATSTRVRPRGTISYKRLNAERWTELPTKLQAAGEPGAADLIASVPDDLEPGTYVFRADAADGAGNTASTTRRADGTEMALRKVAAAGRPRPPGAGSGRGLPLGIGGKDPALRQAALAPPPRPECDRAVRRRGDALRPACSTPTAPGWAGGGCGSSRGRRAAP